jgi:hypothetical protein
LIRGHQRHGGIDRGVGCGHQHGIANACTGW